MCVNATACRCNPGFKALFGDVFTDPTDTCEGTETWEMRAVTGGRGWRHTQRTWVLLEVCASVYPLEWDRDAVFQSRGRLQGSGAGVTPRTKMGSSVRQ